MVLFGACYHPIDDICDSFGLSIKDGVQLIMKVQEEYGGINSDFTCIYIYSITDNNIITQAKEKFHPYKCEGNDSNKLINNYLINTSGYYQVLTSERDEKCLYIDTVNNNIIYCYMHL